MKSCEKTSLEITNDELISVVIAWQNWWQEIGSRWYEELEVNPYERPPFLRNDSPFYGKWL